MLGSMAISSLLFISYFVTYSVNPSRIRTQGQYSPIHQCPNTAYSDIMSSIPVCEPRETLVELPLPRDPMIEEVTPSHVLVPRCSGVCFQGNTYHKCVPESGGRSSQTFQVLFNRRNPQGSGQLEMQCSSINVETHTACKCGCDVDLSNCNSNQQFNEYYCKCRCSNYRARSACLQQRRTKYWDDENCQCLCLQSQWKECSTGYVYDPIDTCDCLPRSASVQMGEEPLIVILAILVVVSVIAVISCIYAYHKRKENQKLQEEISGIQQGENEDLNHQNSQN